MGSTINARQRQCRDRIEERQKAVPDRLYNHEQATMSLPPHETTVPQPSRPPLTKAAWLLEVTEAVSSVGLPLKVSTVLVEQTTPMCYAEFTNHEGRTVSRISVARDRFPTAPDRRKEIVRQLRER